MAKGGNNQKSNGSRFSKPYDTSNSFVKKVATRVSDYLGGWFGTPVKSTGDSMRTGGPPVTAGGDTPTTSASSHGCLDALDNLRESTSLSRPCFDDIDVAESPAKRIKVEPKGKYDIDFPISPIPSTSSGLFSSNINHNFNIGNSDDFLRSGPGPSGLQNQRYAASSTIVQSSTSNADVKANGATDDHSESSESTSGCSSLVPQSDRFSQSAYACTSRKKNLEDKLSYARQLKQSRASLLLNRSIPVGNEGSGNRRKPSFDVTAYGSPMFDKSSVREKMVNSPFYTGQTSYGGASAYKRSRSSSLYAQSRTLSSLDRRGLQLQVKPSHHGSTEDLSNMSHTAKRILEALEQFSTPINDVKRIPINAMNPPLLSKKRRLEDISDTRVKLSTPKSPMNPNAGPSISGLNVPTVPDLLKLKRLERIQNSTAAARQVAVQNQETNREYSLPPVEPPPKAKERTGKIVTKLKDKDKKIPDEKLEEVPLPNVPLPITTLPKFDLQLPPVLPKPQEPKPKPKVKNFEFSPPIAVSTPISNSDRSPLRNNFKFSNPLNAEDDVQMPPLINFAAAAAAAKLKLKSLNDNNIGSNSKKFEIEPAKELKTTGSVMDVLKKSEDSNVNNNKSDTWECSNCLCRNLKDCKNCVGCRDAKQSPKNNSPVVGKTPAPPPPASPPPSEKKPAETIGWGDKFKPPSGSWNCKECFVTNSASATKCISCESPKEKPKEKPAEPAAKPLAPIKNDFGDLFKKKAGQWDCSVCMITNKESDVKCVACETPKPGAKVVEKPEPPKFNFGIPPGGGGFKFGIDKADLKPEEKSTPPNGPKNPFAPAVATSVGVFTFGIPPKATEEKKEEVKAPEVSKADSSMWNNATWAKELASKKEETKETEKPSAETNKTPLFKFSPPDDKKDSKIVETPKFSFGSNLSNSVEVSSSTNNFTFGSAKPAPAEAKPAPSFEFLGAKKETPKFELKESNSAPQIGSTTNFNSDSSGKIATFVATFVATNAIFGSGLKSSNPIFGNLEPATTAQVTTTSSPFQMSTPVFTTSNFNGPNVPSVTNSFNAPVVTKAETTTAFGSSIPAFGSNPTPFGSTNSTPAPAFGNPTPTSTFGVFGTPTPAPTSTFGSSNFNSSSGFGSGFSAPAQEKAPAPFIFGSNPVTTTTAAAPAPTPAASTPAVFAFGASKPEVQSTFGSSFGQNGQQQPQQPGFAFNAPAATTPNNIFGAFSAPKTESPSPFGAAAATFGNSTPINTGMNSAPPAFPSATQGFGFGAGTGSQSKGFQFNAGNPAQQQPASAPATAFTLSVPSSFNFTGGQTPTFNADPTSLPPPSALPQRRIIKAARRTQR